MGKAVPSARTRRKEDVLSWSMVCDIVEKKKADRPKPDKTIAVVVALCVENHKPRKRYDEHYNLRLGRGNSSQSH